MQSDALFRSLDETAPGWDPSLKWPIDGLAYVVMFVGPLGGSLGVGLAVPAQLLGQIMGVLVGAVAGALTTLANALLFDFFVEPLIARVQAKLQRVPILVVTNTIGIAWSAGVCAFAMITTVAIIWWAGIPMKL